MTSGALVTHLVVGLVVVFGVMAVLVQLVKRSRSGLLGTARRAPVIESVARLGLSKSASVALLRVGRRELLVGVGTTGVTLLAETDLGGLSAALPATVDATAVDLTALEGATDRAAVTSSAAVASAVAAPAPAPAPARLPARRVPTTAAGVGPGQAWWPTVVELARERTARTTRSGHR